MLTPHNYHTWKADLTVFLRCENALEIVLGNEGPPPANASFAMRESYKKRFGHATGMVYSSVEPSIRAVINKLPDQQPAHVWTALGHKYNTATSRSGRLAIRHRFQLTTMKLDALVQDFISSLMTIQQELVGTREEISDESLISHLLANLSNIFKSVVDIITIRPADDETLDSISTQLIEYETSNALRKAQIGSNPNTAGTVVEGHALTEEDNTKGTRGYHSGRGRGSQRGVTCGKGRGNGRKPYISKSTGKYFYCLKEGQRQYQCSHKQKAETFQKEINDARSNRKTATVNNVEIKDANPDTVVHGFAAIGENDSGSRTIDSGASHHLTGRKEVFQNLRPLSHPFR